MKRIYQITLFFYATNEPVAFSMVLDQATYEDSNYAAINAEVRTIPKWTSASIKLIAVI